MKTRPILIIIATLIIGFVVGFLVNGYITRQKFQRFVDQDHQNALRHRMMDIIHPDADQTKEIEPILDEYAQQVHNSMMQSRTEIQTLHEKLIDDLEPYLNEQQMERLNRAHKRLDRMMKNRPGRHAGPHGKRQRQGPPPGNR